MQKLANQVALATATLFFSTAIINIKAAQAVTFSFNWIGQINKYSATGLFSYDENAIPEDGIIRKDNLTSFDLAIFDPDGNLLGKFIDNHLTYPEFNFNFDTTTNIILQDGRYDTPTGLDIGFSSNVAGNPKEPTGNGESTGLNIWTSGQIEPLKRHIHLTTYGERFSQLPRQFSAFVPLLDIALFEFTQKDALELLGLDNTNGDDTFGQPVQATQVPEPLTMMGIGTATAFGALFKRKLNKKA